MNLPRPPRPAEFAEKGLICGIINDTFPINSFLPPERELAIQLGVTRPTLREVLQRMARDGWVEIHQGKATRVRDYWKEGNLNVLISLSKIEGHLPDTFVVHLLNIRANLCPAYTSLAIQYHPQEVFQFLKTAPLSTANATEFSKFDVELHSKLTIFSENPVYTLILNGFHELIEQQSEAYFSFDEPRKYSIKFYKALAAAAHRQEYQHAGELAKDVMQISIQFWQQYARKKEG